MNNQSHHSDQCYNFTATVVPRMIVGTFMNSISQDSPLWCVCKCVRACVVCVCVSMVCVCEYSLHMCVHLYTVNFVIQTLLPLHTHVLTSLKAFTSVYSHICI